jgi:hypothetical protein
MIKKYFSLANLLTGKVWSLYGDLVHNVLFLTLVVHGVPQGIILATLRFFESHENLAIILIAALLSIKQHLRSHEKKGRPSTKRRQPKSSNVRS